MKKVILLFAIVICALCCQAQITLEHAFLHKSVPSDEVILFSSNGTKIFVIDSAPNLLRFYKTDYSLWKTVTPPSVTGYYFSNVYYISDNLFNSDDSVEMILLYTKNAGGYGPQNRSFIISESGTIIKDLDSTAVHSVHLVDGVYKLFSVCTIGAPSFMKNLEIFSLPGSLPCGLCGSLGLTEPAGQRPISGTVQAFPNPTKGQTTFTYLLPNGYNSGEIILYDLNGSVLNTYNVDRGSSQMMVNTSQYAPGVYYYGLRSNGTEIQAKKLVKID